MIPQVQELIRTLEQLPEEEQARKAEDLLAELRWEIASGKSTPLTEGLKARRNKRNASWIHWLPRNSGSCMMNYLSQYKN